MNLKGEVMKVYVNVWRVCSIRFTTIQPTDYKEDVYVFSLEGTEVEMVSQLVTNLMPVWTIHQVDLMQFHLTLYDWLAKMLQSFDEFMAKWRNFDEMYGESDG